MNDDQDDSVEYQLDPEEAQEVIEWAVDVAATITLMFHEDEPETAEDIVDQLERFTGIIGRMYECMPEGVSNPAHDLAVAALDRAEYEETQVEEFLNEIKDL